jgi:hypothetical protein
MYLSVLTTAPRPILGRTQLPSQYVTKTISARVKRSGLEAVAHLPLISRLRMQVSIPLFPTHRGVSRN